MDSRTLITGAASGIGLGIARAVAASGGRVLLTDAAGTVHERAAEIGAEAAVLDVTDPAAWATVVGTLDRLDQVVLSAGVRTAEADPARIDPADYLRTIAVNLHGAFYGIRATADLLAASGGGSILVIGSMSAVTPLPRDPVYATTKHALVGLVRSTAPALGERGIAINMLCPGVVETGFFGAGDRARLEALGVVVLDPGDVASAALTILSGGLSGEVFLQPAPGAPVPHVFPVVERRGADPAGR
jgi:NAD(P)-dependent dehydrogenase (short-subunit alcohol dehydrogenase family)